MSKQYGAKEIPVWDGNPDNLPPMGQEFLYKNGKYVWSKCDCGCNRPEVIINGEHDFVMSTRLRGNNQGDPVATVLCKLGKMEQLIEVEQAGGHEFALAKLFSDSLREMPVHPARNSHEEVTAYLATKGISEMEMSYALEEIISAAGPGIALLSMLFG